MVRGAKGFFLLLAFLSFAGSALAQVTAYDLRKLTQQQWLSMTTEERLTALSTSNRQAQNQTFLGDFNEGGEELYKRWGYDFYEINDKYENYSFRRPEGYDILNQRRSKWSYNEFGDRIPYMRRSYVVWNETYNKLGSFSIATSDSGSSSSNYINSIATDGVDGVWVVKEATDDWGMSFVYAGALRNYYTPLTLRMPNIGGLRIDLQSANTSVSVVNSPLIFNVTRGTANDLYTYGAPILRGGRLQHKFGALTLGATYANAYVAQGARYNHDSWYGTVNTNAYSPLYLAVRVLDDSPRDGEGGPTVRDVRLKINGRYRDDIKPTAIIDDLSRDRTSAIIDKGILGVYPVMGNDMLLTGPTFDLLSEENIPKYADYIYYMSYLKGANAAFVSDDLSIAKASEYYHVVDASSPVEVNGNQYVIYLYNLISLDETVYRAEVEMTVDNDYRVECSYIYPSSGSYDDSVPTSSYGATYWRTEAQADGNVKDGSNVKRITVQFGIQVASVTYGMDMNFNYWGFKVSGEFVTNANHYMYPEGLPNGSTYSVSGAAEAARTGQRYSDRDNAYYIVSQKDWNRFGFSGEYFKMGKFYRPWLDHFIAGGISNGNTMGDISSRNSTMRIPLVEDNDDEDQYPDTMIASRSMGTSIYSIMDPDGVFPGNDADHDGVADNNRNGNSMADYDEPFLMFDSDPDQFVFGDDFNNNGIPDFREDDMKLDTPYDLDRTGYHFSFRYTPLQNITVLFGSMQTHEVGGDDRTNADYLKLKLNYDVFDIGNVYAEYRHERIQDNIADDFVQVSNVMGEYLNPGYTFTTARFDRELYDDELEYENSSVDRLFFESKIRAIPSITVENDLKLERNHQIEGTMYNNVYQAGQNIGLVAMVNKISYTKAFGNWVFSPGIKFRLYKKDRDEAVRANESYLTRIPVVTLKYVISPRTDVTLGMQGVPGMTFHYDDRANDANDYDQKSYVLQFQNGATYMGYQIWAGTGIRYDDLRYCKSDRSYENYRSSTTFVKVYLGY